ncbi:MAG: DUF4386 domain-containing protein, partial [Cyclobacteriaceae bacterium]|nr:DUF4386 domain-containing protein [Cyclobacteriaceae bacterium]
FKQPITIQLQHQKGGQFAAKNTGQFVAKRGGQFTTKKGGHFTRNLQLYHSHQFPKVLSILLMLGCLTYLINFFGNTLNEDYKSLGFPSYLSMVSGIAEIGTCFWLIIFGFKQKPN